MFRHSFDRFSGWVSRRKAAAYVVPVGAAGALILSSGSAFAALSTEEQAMVDAVVAKINDLVGAVASLATANVALAAAIVVAGLIIGYIYGMRRK